MPDGRVAGELEYDADLFDDATAARWLGFWQRTLEGFVAQPGQPVGGLTLLKDADRAWIERAGWSGSAYPYVPVADLIAACAAAVPDEPAVRDIDGTELSYAALQGLADRLAGALSRACDVRGRPVALAADRGPSLIAGLLGILRAGGIAMPLDLHLPTARLAVLLREAQPAAVLADTAGRAILPDTDMSVVPLEDASGPPGPLFDPAADNPAYLLFHIRLDRHAEGRCDAARPAVEPGAMADGDLGRARCWPHAAVHVAGL